MANIINKDFIKGYQEAVNDFKERLNHFDATATYKSPEVVIDIIAQEVLEMQNKCILLDEK